MKPFISLFRRLLQAIKKFEMEGNWFFGHRENSKAMFKMREKLHIKSKVMLQDLINGKYKLKHGVLY